MKSNDKGRMTPEIPSTTWEFMAMARDVLGLPAFHRIFGVEKSQISRWAVNPDFSADSQRNPIDRVRMLFERMIEAGEVPAVMAALTLLAEPVGLRVESGAAITPEHENIRDELLDIHPACSEHAQMIREAQPLRVVEHWEREAIRQIQEATESYRLGLAGAKE